MNINPVLAPPEIDWLTSSIEEKKKEENNKPIYNVPKAEDEYKNTPDFDSEELKRKIFEWRWYITTRKKWTYSQMEYQDIGIFVTGDLDHDLEMMDDWTDTTRTISDLVEFHAEGREFILKYSSDVEKIFNIIQEYTAYIAYVFSNNLSLQSKYSLNKPETRELLEDVIKLQNLANQLFPVMVNLNREYVVHTKGLFGFLFNEQYQSGDVKLEFDPLAKYGLTKEDIRKEENIDKETGLYKALDLQNIFDPRTFELIRKI